jgi:ribosomal protein S24E
MDLKITEKKEEPLLSRAKLIGELAFDGATPSYEDVKKKIASSLNCDEKLIAIRNIYTDFGVKKAELFAYVYNKEEAMKKIEPRPKEGKAKEAKPARKAEEKPKEEKEQPKEEKK